MKFKQVSQMIVIAGLISSMDIFVSEGALRNNPQINESQEQRIDPTSSTQQPTSKPSDNMQRGAMFFTALDYSVSSNANKPFEDETANAYSVLNTAGYQGIQAKTKTTDGAGARVGVMFPIQGINGFELGSSLGYFIGPKVEQTISAPAVNLLGAIDLSNTTKTHYLRWLIEGSKKFNIRNGLFFKIGASAGVAQGKAEESGSASGPMISYLGLPSTTSASETWTGFTWEINPAVVLTGDQADFEFGIRYAQFPSHDETIDFVKIQWSPLFLYAGISF